MTHYFIDIGNSRIKCTTPHLPFCVKAYAHKDWQQLFDFITAGGGKHLFIISGRSAIAQQSLHHIVDFAKTQSINTQIFSIDSDYLQTNYHEPKQFGLDRWFNLIGAKKRYRDNFCIISAGTAIVLDCYCQKHVGGMILPGLGITKQLLQEKTGLAVIAKPNHLLGDDTASSIGAGIYVGYHNLISHSIERLNQQYHQKFQVILTGGDCQTLEINGDYHPHLLFEGMLAYCTQKGLFNDHH